MGIFCLSKSRQAHRSQEFFAHAGLDPLLACDVTQSPTFVSICLHVDSLQLFRIQIDSERHPRKGPLPIPRPVGN
jgi:hypothetical protein